MKEIVMPGFTMIELMQKIAETKDKIALAAKGEGKLVHFLFETTVFPALVEMRYQEIDELSGRPVDKVKTFQANWHDLN